MWDALHSAEFEAWLLELTPEQQGAITAAVTVLEETGPTLGRPLVDRIEGSAFHNMKELRVSQDGDLRVLFAFDMNRRPVLLVGGDKTGEWNEWYSENIPIADVLFTEHQDSIKSHRESQEREEKHERKGGRR
jgi:hypothetical protein